MLSSEKKLNKTIFMNIMADSKKINPNKLAIRDWVMVGIINGATKAAVHKDRKKEANKKFCRKPIKEE